LSLDALQLHIVMSLSVSATYSTVSGSGPNLRIDTVTGYLRNLDQLLDQARFSGSKTAAELREQIREFNSTAMLFGREETEL
jgi:hypothetical protein